MKRTLVAALVYFPFFLLAWLPASAQITGRTGLAPRPEILELESPMILEVPLPALADSRLGSQISIPNDIRKYVCDKNVFFTNLNVAKHLHSRGRDRMLDLVLSGFLSVQSSYDRFADVTVRLKKEREILGSGTTLKIGAEETRSTPFRVRLMVSESELMAAYASEPHPVLEITLVVRDNR